MKNDEDKISKNNVRYDVSLKHTQKNYLND